MFIYLHLRSFSFIYHHSPSFTLICLHLHLFTFIYIHLPSFTFTYVHLPSFTFIYFYLPWSTVIYVQLPLSNDILTFIHLHLPLSGFIHVNLSSSTLNYVRLPSATSIYLHLPSCAPFQRRVRAQIASNGTLKNVSQNDHFGLITILRNGSKFCRSDDWLHHGTRCYEKVGISDKLRRIAHFHFHFVWFCFVCMLSQISVSRPNQQQDLLVAWGWKINCCKTIRKNKQSIVTGHPCQNNYWAKRALKGSLG